MRFKRYILLSFLLSCFLLHGCTKETKPVQPGKLESISLSQAKEKMNNKESFVIVITMNSCSHCANFKAMLDQYLPQHSVIVYELLLDHEADIYKAFEDAKQTFPEFYGTPGLYYIEKGECKSIFWQEYDELNETHFHSWLLDHECL